MIPVHNLPISVSAIDQLRETAPRRQIYAEMAALKEAIRNFALTDAATQDIQLWCGSFEAALHLNADIQRTWEGFVPRLQELLIDPISRRPFTRDALLGSDGNTYNRETLLAWREGAPEEYRHRSPLDLHNIERLVVRDHPIVHLALEWLERRAAGYGILERPFVSTPGILTVETNPVLPTISREARAARILEIQRRQEIRERRFASRFNAGIQEIREEAARTVIQINADYDERERNISLIAQEQIAQIASIRQKDDLSFSRLQKGIANCEVRIEALKKNIVLLQQNIESIIPQLERVENVDRELDVAILQIQKEVHEREKMRVENWAKVAALCAGCAFGTWMITVALETGAALSTGAWLNAFSEMSVKVFILPLSSGNGVILNVVIPL